jgi:hypothetical protein
MEALVTLLTREKTLVELLVFKLVTMRQLLLAGETRFLPWIAEEVERATASVRDVELERAVLVLALGLERGLEEVSLSELIEDAPEPWQGLLVSLHGDLRAGAEEVQQLLQSTRRLADVGARTLAESLGEEPVPAGAAYGPTGRTPQATRARYQQDL